MTRHPLPFILAVAFALRVWGLSFGLPHVYHQDEAIVVNHALAIGVDGWNTRTYLPPQFASYALFLVYAVYFVAGRVLGVFHGAEDFALTFLKDPTPFYLLARFFLGVVFGTATIAVLYRMGRFFSEKTAFWAALFLSVAFLHVQHSHYVYMDIALAFATTLLFYFLLKGLGQPSWPNTVAQGLLFGWAVAVKYTAVYFFPSIVLVACFSKKDTVFEKLQKIAVAGALSLLAYAVISPYSFLDWNNFITQVKGQSAARGFSGPLHHLTYSLTGGTGLLFMLCAAAGIALLLKRRTREGLVLASGLGIYYIVNVYFSQSFARYMMPLVPLLCLAAAFAIEWIPAPKGGGRIFKYVFLTLLMTEMLLPSVYSDLLFKTEDTRTQCARWFDTNVPAGTRVALDNRFFGPHLPQSAELIGEKEASLPSGLSQTARGKRLELQRKAIGDKKTYDVYVLSKNAGENAETFMFLKPFVQASQSGLQEKRIRYLVLNYSEVHEEYHALKDAVGEWELKIFFSPYRDSSKKIAEDKNASTAAPHLLNDLLSRQRLGPYLEVYELKHAG